MAIMLPTPDFRGMFVFLVLLLSFPLLVGGFITIVAAFAGADGVGRITKIHYLFATTGGGLIGCLMIAAIVFIGLYLAANWIGILIMLCLAFILGPLGAFNTARMVGRRLR
jgi:hypothetical protein